MWNLAPLDLFQLGTTWTAVIAPSVAARLILNLRSAFVKDFQSTTHTSAWGPPAEESIELRMRSVANNDTEEFSGAYASGALDERQAYSSDA